MSRSFDELIEALKESGAVLVPNSADLGELYRNAVHSLESLRARVAELERDVDLERMRLAACGVAALANTVETVRQRIERGHAYWSASYGDVCTIVDSEMALRAERDAAIKERDEALERIVELKKDRYL